MYNLEDNIPVEIRGCTAFAYSKNNNIIYGRNNDCLLYTSTFSCSASFLPISLPPLPNSLLIVIMVFFIKSTSSPCNFIILSSAYNINVSVFIFVNSIASSFLSLPFLRYSRIVSILYKKKQTASYKGCYLFIL